MYGAAKNVERGNRAFEVPAAQHVAANAASSKPLRLNRKPLEKLDWAHDILHLETVVQELQVADDFTDLSCALPRIDDTGVLNTGLMMSQEVVVLSENDASLGTRINDVL